MTILNGCAVGAAFALFGTTLPEMQGQPLGDVRVRQALSLAIDRQTIVDTLLGGIGFVPSSPAVTDDLNPDWTPEFAAKWKPWFENAYRYDPEEAKRLLAEAGFADGFTWDFWSAPDGAAAYLGDLVQVCAGYWQAIGITTNIIPVDESTFNAARVVTQSSSLIGKGGANASTMTRPSSLVFATRFSPSGPMDLLSGTPEEAEIVALNAKGITLEMGTPEYIEVLDRIFEIGANSWTTFHIVGSPLTFAFGPRVEGRVTPGVQRLGYDALAWKYTGA